MDIHSDNAGNLFATGFFMTTDFDHSAGILQLTSYGTVFNCFVAKYSTTSAVVFARAMGGTIGDNGNAIAVDGAGKLVFISGGTGGTFKSFSGEKFLSSGFFLSRYEE